MSAIVVPYLMCVTL